MVELRYNVTKVVGVSQDYAEYEKFADMWLPAKTGTDGALAMAMTHDILKEFYVDKQTPYFFDYAKKYTDLPYLVLLTKKDGGFRSDRFLRASDISQDEKLAEWKTVVWDENLKNFVIPNGSQGFHWDEGKKWSLDMTAEDGSEISPLLSFLMKKMMLH
ncbi:molybdopterin-dependent oxidoreductase [Bacillus sp. X1(2014)]|uniref:molybdopterin-dependent oxidoreductase n=1 Tax=Bacillus sp. X1(2014) TaxID=1565991 RepID=UPI0037C0B328